MYHALLPEQSVKGLKTEYHIRLFVVALFVLSFSVAVAAACLVPSYFLASTNERQSEAKAKALMSAAASTTLPALADLSAAGALSSSISSFVSPSLSDIVIHIDALRPGGIAITSIDVVSAGAALAVTLQGTAATRDDLVNFRKVLEADQAFSGVTVPISDLAPSSHLQFSLQMSAVAPVDQ